MATATTMRSPSVTTTAAGAVLAVTTTAAAGWYMMRKRRQDAIASSSALALTEIDDEDTDANGNDYITAQDVSKFFDRLFLEMQAILGQLMQQIQMSGAASQFPERQLKALIRGEMERALLIKQKQVAESLNMDLDCIEEATWEFLEQPDQDNVTMVQRAVERLQRLWENATGDEVVGWRRDNGNGSQQQQQASGTNTAEYELLPPHRLIEVADLYFTALSDAMKDLVATYQRHGRDVSDPQTQQELNMEFASTANDAGEAALQDVNVTMSQFEASVKMHAHDPTVGRALAGLQMRQQQELASLQQQHNW